MARKKPKPETGGAKARGLHPENTAPWQPKTDAELADLPAGERQSELALQAMDEATRLFLQTYLASGGSPVEVSLPFYKAAHCLKAAEWEVQAGDLQWRKWAEAMLDEGLRTLA